MENKSVLKTSVLQKLHPHDIEQSQCVSSVSEQPQPLQKTKSQLCLPEQLGQLNGPIKSQDCPSRGVLKPMPIRRGLKGFRLCRKIRKSKRNESDYRKNICGYITKKVMREFFSPNYADRVRGLCEAYDCDYNQAKNFYSNRVERVTGPSHLPELLMPGSVFQTGIKKVFVNFFNWFLKERYVRYLLVEGKMADKRAYIEYKNENLLPLISSKAKESKIKIQQPEREIQYRKIIVEPRRRPAIQIPIVIRHCVKQEQN